MKKCRLGITFFFVLFFVAACTTNPDLTPAPKADTVSGMEERAIESVKGVRMTATSDSWTGRPSVKQEVTPVKVTIRNNHGSPIRVRYEDFALINPAGERYAALPPYNIEGEIKEPFIASAYDPVASPDFYYQGFYIAHPYAPVYPTVPPATGPFYYDPYYYNRYYRYWMEIPLPTPEMLAQALPEGVINDGGEVSGFVYFERVNPDAPRVQFTADLIGVPSGEVFGRVTIPFVVE